MLVSGNMTPQKMGRKVGEKKYFKKKNLPHILFYDPFVSRSTTKNSGVEDQKKKEKKIKYIFWSSMHLFVKYTAEIQARHL